MSRVTKSQAQDWADVLVAGNNAVITEKKKVLATLADGIYLKYVPENVAKALKSNPSFVSTSTNVYFVSKRNNNDQVRATVNTPAPINRDMSSYQAYFTVAQSDYEKVLKKVTEITKLKSEVDSLKKNLEEVLFSLRTHKKVGLEFPSLEPLLAEVARSSALPSNLAELKSKIIKKQ